MVRAAAEEVRTRAFYEERGILSQPETLGHYLMAPMPAYLEPIVIRTICAGTTTTRAQTKVSPSTTRR